MTTAHEELVWQRYLISLDQKQHEIVDSLVKEIEEAGVLDYHLARVHRSIRLAIRNANQADFTPLRTLEAYGWDIDWNWVEQNIDGFCAPVED